MRRPNVLLLYTDQQRLDTLSYLHNCGIGEKIAIETPNIDKLASQGAFFNNYFVNNPVCGPSRMSFLSGLYPCRVGVGDNGYGFPDDLKHIGNYLAPYGYTTAQIGKIHFEPHVKRWHEDPAKTFGFDTAIISDEPGCYNDAYTKWIEGLSDCDQVKKARTQLPPAGYGYGKENYTQQGREVHEPYLFEADEHFTHSQFVKDETIEFIKQQNEAKPFFCIAGFYSPHPPLNPHVKYVERVCSDYLTGIKVGKDDKVMDILKDLTAEDWNKIKTYYLALVCEIDDCVGEILAELKNKNLEEDTLVIFTSDHGEYLGDHGRIQKGMPGYDCVVNVPFIVKYPKKIKSGQIIDSLAEGVDFVPTVLDFCSIQKPKVLQGDSLYSLLVGNTNKHKAEIFCERFYDNKMAESMIRTKEYKYAIAEGREFLFDLNKDPYELENLILDNKYSAVLADMRLKMIFKLSDLKRCSLEKICEY